MYPNGRSPFLPLYEDLHDIPFKPIRREEERKVLESVDVIMSQVRKKLELFDPGTIDLIAVEHNIRTYCIEKATYACRAIGYEYDMEEVAQWKIQWKTKKGTLLKAILGGVHGPKNKSSVRVIVEKAAQEAFYYQKNLKPCDIKLGTHFKEDPSEYRYIGLA
ncbi:unnamed protein product [Clonostachys rosea]|uniref:Uncharacterized protein n=1 Tax=Bionectria ochroleuca TaxID=29856 RepID=A0ABY6V2N2_BIOOC|nr:unnamed protein product [Clonostachys rosea]